VYTLVRNTPLRRLLALVTPSFLIAFAIAELFYKFKSFALECAAFLLTWALIEAALTGLNHLWAGRSAPSRFAGQ
jgi:hypothetical protein